jgi:hypothetical protein
MKTTQEQLRSMEDLIHRFGVDGLLAQMRDVCCLKAEHAASIGISETPWLSRARHLENCLRSIAKNEC